MRFIHPRLNLLFAGRFRHISSIKSNRAILIMSNNSRGFLAFTAAMVLGPTMPSIVTPSPQEYLPQIDPVSNQLSIYPNNVV